MMEEVCSERGWKRSTGTGVRDQEEEEDEAAPAIAAGPARSVTVPPDASLAALVSSSIDWMRGCNQRICNLRSCPN